jgi:ABC-type Mn2+/Zn2+ transport system ATPase subunit
MPPDTVPAVVVRDLTVRYGPGGAVTAVDGLRLEAEAGEVLVVLGPNGAGKTSTIESLEGYRRPAGGHISVLGLHPIADHHQLTLLMGVMLQNGGVYPMLGPRQVIDLFSHYYPEPLATDALLDLVALRAVAATPWRHLSGGEKQRLSLALALIGRPKVAFLDEPTAGVDPEGRLAIRAVVGELRSQGVCVLLTTHELTEADVRGPARARHRGAGGRARLGGVRVGRRARPLPGQRRVRPGDNGDAGHLVGRAQRHADRPGRRAHARGGLLRGRRRASAGTIGGSRARGSPAGRQTAERQIAGWRAAARRGAWRGAARR